jgi:hypothetical protein
MLKTHIDMLENVQRRCTKLGPLVTLCYHDRLVQKVLYTLETRRKRADLIQIIKYV